MGDSKTFVGRSRPACDVTKKTLYVTPTTGIWRSSTTPAEEEEEGTTLSRAAEQRNLENGGVPVPPRRRAVVGEGPARYTYLRSGDINKC